VPTFCRHSRFIQNCPICSRELEADQPKAPPRSRGAAQRRATGGSTVRIRQAGRTGDDGYRSELAPGLRVAADGERLAAEIGFSAARLAELASSPPGLYAELASEPDLEEATWLAFQIAYFSPTEDDDPFATIRAVRTPWAGGELPAFGDEAVAPGPTGEVPSSGGKTVVGPRSASDPGRGPETIVAYRRWAQRAGTQAEAFTGEAHWDAERRFARAFERLALPGFPRTARFDLLVALGRTGRYEMRAGSLLLAGAAAYDDTAVAAKRVFGIADPLLIDRRAAALAEVCEVPLEALDLALFNWQRGEDERATLAAGPGPRADSAGRERAAAALGV
jgi:hypothetical protein